MQLQWTIVPFKVSSKKEFIRLEQIQSMMILKYLLQIVIFALIAII
jgi:hypothetical protein